MPGLNTLSKSGTGTGQTGLNTLSQSGTGTCQTHSFIQRISMTTANRTHTVPHDGCWVCLLQLAWTWMEPSGAWTEHTFKVRDYWGACWWGQQYQVERAGGANNIGAPDHGAAGAPLLVLLIIRLLFIIRPRAAVYGAAVCPRAAVYNSPWCS